MFPFYGVGNFSDPARPPPGTPLRLTDKDTTCSFCHYTHVKARDSILWVGPAVRTCQELAGRSGRVMHLEGSDQRGWGGEAPARLYKYNGNLLQLGKFACSELSPAARITACGKFLSARGNGKSAGGKWLWRMMEKAQSGKKKKLVTSISAIDTFHDGLVSSRPTLLQIVPFVTRNHISAS
jgi:hypothetical protein